MRKPRRKWGWPDTIRAGGLAIAFHETLWSRLEKPYLLGLSWAMMTLARGFDRVRRGAGDEESS